MTQIEGLVQRNAVSQGQTGQRPKGRIGDVARQRARRRPGPG
jgi:hypothetical protein